MAPLAGGCGATIPGLARPQEPELYTVSQMSIKFCRLNCSLSYCPGSCNTKPDALSQLHSMEGGSSESGSILPSTCFMAALTWEIEALVTQVQAHQADPGTGPSGRMLVPDAVRSEVLQWGHSSWFTCHPGIARTLAFPLTRTGTPWPSSLSAYPQPPLVPHSTGFCHWSRGKTTILTVVDRFSKAAYFVTLPRLPSARETAELLVS